MDAYAQSRHRSFLGQAHVAVNAYIPLAGAGAAAGVEAGEAPCSPPLADVRSQRSPLGARRASWGCAGTCVEDGAPLQWGPRSHCSLAGAGEEAGEQGAAMALEVGEGGSVLAVAGAEVAAAARHTAVVHSILRQGSQDTPHNT
jgi:hypothetical protein